MANQIEEIKARIDIVDLVSEYINLKQAGTNWRALCPFHNEKTSSFMVSRDKQIWHCFGCSEGGDIFSFVQKIEGLDFAGALKLLAKKAGVKLEFQDPQESNQRNRILDICQLAASFWHKILLESPQAEKARQYLKDRQLSDQTIEEFKIGYAPDAWETTVNFLKGRGFTENEIFLAGLTVKKDRGAGFYDRFRDRITFPINNISGSPVGFSARTMKKDEKEAKYINTPQTEIYNKSLILYNLDKAKVEIKKQQLAILVEGQMDAIASYQAGAQNVIASSGTALTADQITILKRYSDNLAIAFDTDAAGESASRRGIDIALAQEMNVKVITLPHGKDPDECIKKNPEDWFSAIKNAKSIIQYYFDQVTTKFDLASADGKKQAAKILLSVIVKINNKIEQTHWLQKLADRLNVSEQILRDILATNNNRTTKTGIKAPLAAKPAEQKDRGGLLSEIALALALKFSQQLPYLIDNLRPEMLSGATDVQQLYRDLIIYYTDDITNKVDEFDYQSFKSKLAGQNLVQLADSLVLLAEKDFFDFDQDLVRDEMIKTVEFLKRDYYSTQLKEIQIKIRQAEQNNNLEEIETLSQKFNSIINQLNLLN